MRTTIWMWAMFYCDANDLVHKFPQPNAGMAVAYAFTIVLSLGLCIAQDVMDIIGR